ncbi:MAG: cell wall-binding repeat-containing protein, partial [Desulfitobacterium sp.]|nr:cell wall-binding repeat-containing protein [Desulfitobacterium sp.]
MRKWKRMALLLALGCCIFFAETGVPVYGSTIAEEGYIQEENIQESSIKEITSDIKEITIERLSGGTRFETAQVIAEHFGQGEMENVVLTTGHKFADALSASVLAYELKAPILLVDWTVAKSQDTFNFISENLPSHGKVYIVGGKGIISEDFEVALRKNGYENLIRIEGQDRYETSFKIANYLKELEEKGLEKEENDERTLEEVEVQESEIEDGLFIESETKQNEFEERKSQGRENPVRRNQVREINTVVIASGEEYSDALSISGIAANNGWPILLSPPHELPGYMAEYLKTTNPSQIFILGGEGAISQNLISQINLLLPESNIKRINGKNRLDTNILIARTFAAEPHSLFLTTGYNFADALAGSLLAAENGDPIVYVNPNFPTIPKEAS